MEALSDLIHSDSGTNTISNNSDIYLKLERRSFEDDKEYKRYIKAIERIIRGSVEYKEFVTFCRDTLKATTCSFTGWNIADTDDIEIHHYPLTLFEIVQGVIDDRIAKGKEFSTFELSAEIMKLHFNMNIGIVTLSGTLHKSYHAGVLKIPIEFVVGKYSYLIDNYQVSSEIADQITDAKTININNGEYAALWNKFSLNNLDSIMKHAPNVLDAEDGVTNININDLNIPDLG